MVDNVEAASGTGGPTFATDDDGTAHHPYVKVEFGADNTQTKVSTSNPLPVDIRAENASVTVDNGGTFVVQEDGNALTALQLIDDPVVTLGTDTYTEATSKGGVIGAVRNDNLAALADTDNEFAPLQVDASGALYVQEGSALDVSAATITVQGDNSGSLTVDTDGGALDVSAATVTVDLGANNDVTIDSSSIVHAEDAVHGTGDAGVMSLAVRQDTGATLVSTDGDYSPLQVDGSGNLRVNVASAGTEFNEDTAHTTGDAGTMILGVRNDTLASLVDTDGDYAPLQVNASGALYIQEGSALDVSGATVTVDLGANNDVTIDDSSIVKAEDAAHGSGDAGVMALAVRNDDLAALGGTDGDYAPIQVDDRGAAYVTPVPTNNSGAKPYYNNDVDESEDDVTTSPCVIYSIHCMNLSSSVIYLQLFNDTAANVTVGTTTPTNQFPIATQGDTNGAGFTISFPTGMNYDTALSVAASTDNEGNTAPGANEVMLNLTYQD